MQDVTKLPTQLQTDSPHHCHPPSVSDSVQESGLRDAIAALRTQVASLTEMFDTIEARLGGLVYKQATFEITLYESIESQQDVVSTITVLTEKLDFIATRFESLTAIPPKKPLPWEVLTNDACSTLAAHVSTPACVTTTPATNISSVGYRRRKGRTG